MANCGMCDTSMYCPIHRPDPYRSVQPAPAAVVTVTQRQLPTPCAVCGSAGNRPELFPDEPEGDWKQCDACKGKGWTLVTETTTVRSETAG